VDLSGCSVRVYVKYRKMVFKRLIVPAERSVELASSSVCGKNLVFEDVGHKRIGVVAW
jgi:hypothetical protein